MGKVKYATGIDYVQGSLAKPKVKEGHTCGTYLIGTHRTAATTNPNCTSLYVREADTYKRTSQPSGKELAARARFTAVSAAIKARNRWMVDNSDLIICYIIRNYGGAADAVKYARHKEKRIINPAD